MIFKFTLIAVIATDPIKDVQNCSIQKIRVTGAQLYTAYNWSKSVMKSLGHFNGIYELEEDQVANHPIWTKKRPDSKSDVSLQWTDDIFGATGWLLTNTPGQPRFFSYSVDDCPGNLGNWQLLEYGNKTVIGNEKLAEKIKVESLGDFKPIPSWVLAQMDDQSDFEAKSLVPISDVYTMLAHITPDNHYKVHTYGCNGISDLQFYSTPGVKTDVVTGAINEWKRCVTCAQTTLGATADPYMFDTDNNICRKYLVETIFFRRKFILVQGFFPKTGRMRNVG